MLTGAHKLLALCSLILWIAVLAAAQGRTILSADYGVGDRNRLDVTSQVQSMVRNRGIDLVVSPDVLQIADPAYGTVKELWIRVGEPNGRVSLYRFRDGENVRLRLNTWDVYDNVLSPQDQARFDSYYSRWEGSRRRRDRDEIVSMEKRMREVMNSYKIPPDTPFEFVASARLVPSRSAWTALRLEWASYGSGPRTSDVTDRLRGRIQNNALQVWVNNDGLGGDPAPGERKQLFVVYFYEGQRREATVNEGDELRIP